MGVIDLIAETKSAYLRGQGKLVQAQAELSQKVNLAEAELTRQKQELREAQQIRADLRQDRMKGVEGQQPSKFKKLGQGMAAHMNKNKSRSPPRVGVPKSSGSRGFNTAGKSSPFGGTRNIDVGGTGSPFNPQQKPKVQPKKTIKIVIDK